MSSTKAPLIFLLLAFALNANSATADQRPGLSFDVLANDKVLWSGELTNEKLSSRHSEGNGKLALVVSTSLYETGCTGLFFGEESIVGFDKHTLGVSSISMPRVQLSGQCIPVAHRSDLVGKTVDIGLLEGAESRDSYSVRFHKQAGSFVGVAPVPRQID